MKKHKKREIELACDLPHVRFANAITGNSDTAAWPGVWRHAMGKKRAEFYLARVIKLGMSETDAQCMIGDLFWDCYNELLEPTPLPTLPTNMRNTIRESQ